MGLDNPLDLDQDRRCRSLAAVQNTAEEDPRRACCGDTAREGDKPEPMVTIREQRGGVQRSGTE